MRSTHITEVLGRRIWDSRGRPTVEVEVVLAGGARGRGAAPAGASRGSGEAVDLRDGGVSFGGWDVRRSLSKISEVIAPMVCGTDAADQRSLDARLIALDGTPDRREIGGNALVATSIAVAHAAAAAAGVPLYRWIAGSGPVSLPLPEIQIIGGGAHAGRRTDIQDFMVVPKAASTFEEALDWAAEVYRAAGELFAALGVRMGVADEGGWWPAVGRNEQALEILTDAIGRAGYAPGDEVGIALDVAASELGRNGYYRLGLEDRMLDSDGLCEQLVSWINRYPICSVEDPLGEDDQAGLTALTKAVGDRVVIVADDHTVTDASRVRQAAAAGAANALLVKPNQAGTLSSAKEALDEGRAAGWDVIVSARSGETEDTTISHLSVAWCAEQLKVGAIARSERCAKWNEVLRIAEDLGTTSAIRTGRLRPSTHLKEP